MERSNESVSGDDGNLRFPVSFGQERLWVLENLTSQPLYTHAVAADIVGPLDEDALSRAIAGIAQRHEALRTRLEHDNGRLVQLVAPQPDVEIARVDVTDLPEGDRVQAAEEHTLAFSRQRLDLRRGPLFKTLLIRLAPDAHRLVFCIHHAISDGWSMRVLNEELFEMYEAYSSGRPPQLDPLPIQYGDYASWQRELLSGPHLDRLVSYWQKVLDSAPPLLDLPVDRPRPSVQTFNGDAVSVRVDSATTEGLAGLADRAEATEFMVMLAAFAVLLWRYTGERDLVVATPVAGRNRSEVEGLIGFFVNTLLMRVDLSEDPSFLRLIRRVRETALDAYENQDLPFEKVVEVVDPDRDLSHLPLAQVMFVLQSNAENDLSLPGLDVTPQPLPVETSPFDLTLELYPQDAGFEGSLIFNSDLFDRATIEQMARHFGSILSSIAADPGLPISSLQYCSLEERDRLLHGWYTERSDFMEGATVDRVITSWARQDPERPAAVSGTNTMTYGELNERANRLAHYLLSKGLEPEEHVALLLDGGPDALVAMLGVWKAGGAYLPLDPHGPPERLAGMLQMAGVRTVLTERKYLERGSEISLAGSARFQSVFLDSDWPRIRRLSGEDPLHRSRGAGLAYTIFTSGSTGKPKGVMIQHSGALHMARIGVHWWGVEPDTRFCQFMSLSFDASVAEILPTLVAGACLYFGSREELLPGPGLIEFLKLNRITTLLLTPSALAAMPVENLPDLRTLVLCGEACAPDLVKRWSFVPRIVNGYGPTEVTVTSHAALVEADGTPPPIGRPHPNTRAYVLDDFLEPVPFNVRGELWVGSIGLARGYLGRPDLTVERFLPDPHSPHGGDRMYRTGDVVRMRRDGQLDFLGRADHQVKVRGFRIELAEIEAALAAIPTIEEAAVVVADRGTSRTRLVAYYSAPHPVTPAELRRALAPRLPDYMIPSVFVPLEELPHLASGKVDRRGLPEPDLGADGPKPSAPPVSDTERRVAAVWAGILGGGAVGRDEKFFEVGGNSLQLVEMWTELDRLYPGALSVADLFEHATVAAIAGHLDGWGPPVPAEPAIASYEL